MVKRKPVLILLCITFLAPIVLYTDQISSALYTPSDHDFLDNVNLNVDVGNEAVNAVHEESSESVKEPDIIIFSDNLRNADQILNEPSKELVQEVSIENHREHKLRLLSVADEETQLHEHVIQQVTEKDNAMGFQFGSQKVESSKVQEFPSNKQQSTAAIPDYRLRQLKDQLIRARVYQSLNPLRNNPHFTRELRARIIDVQRVIGDATKDSELPKSANEKLRLMEQTLAKANKIQDDCSTVVKKLRAMLHSSEEQLKVHKKQTMFLTQLAAKTLPKGLHCLPLRLTTEYYSLDTAKQQFPNQNKLEYPSLYHYALFSDNVLAASVVVNSTITNAKHPSNHVFHIVTDRLNYATMRMWFLANPPGKAIIQVQNIEEFTWLNETYSPVLKQLGSQSMINYYFRTHRANSDRNLKFRNPKYLSILNHLRFYLPEIFPKLNKVLFLDDDIVVQRDISGLWGINLEGKVNGVVETCGESFHRFDRYLNFSHPLIAKNFDPHACGWAYEMNVYDKFVFMKVKVCKYYC